MSVCIDKITHVLQIFNEIKIGLFCKGLYKV